MSNGAVSSITGECDARHIPEGQILWGYEVFTSPKPGLCPLHFGPKCPQLRRLVNMRVTNAIDFLEQLVQKLASDSTLYGCPAVFLGRSGSWFALWRLHAFSKPIDTGPAYCMGRMRGEVNIIGGTVDWEQQLNPLGEAKISSSSG
jgi:hypothetical protein